MQTDTGDAGCGWGAPVNARAEVSEFDKPFSDEEKSPASAAPEQDDAEQPSAWAGLERTPTPPEAQEESGECSPPRLAHCCHIMHVLDCLLDNLTIVLF